MTASLTDEPSRARTPPPRVVFRHEVHRSDLAAVRELVEAAGVFSTQEQRIAAELVEERLSSGRKSGYSFVFAQEGGSVVGYTAYGLIPGTLASYDLYWIVIDRAHQGHGLGAELLARTERVIAEKGGQKIYVETSSRRDYTAARAFYRRAGYRRCALLRDFYAPGDSKLILYKGVVAAPKC